MKRLPDDAITVENVSSHAVTRYVQRVLGVTVDVDETKIGGRGVALQHCHAAGMTLDEVKLLILCPEVRLALALGAIAVRTSRFQAALNSAQRLVVTIKHRRHSPGFMVPKAYSEPSRNESRRASHRFTRRDRRRHKSGPTS